MRLSREICLGGRLNGKEILGIKYNGCIIYPLEREEDYSDCIVAYASERIASLPELYGYSDSDYIVEESVNNNGLIITKIKPVDENKLPNYISFYDNDTVKKIMKLRGNILVNAVGWVYSFRSCELLEYINVSEIDISNISTLNNFFDDCTNLTTIVGLNNFNTEHITDMAGMFSNCKKIKSINLSSFDTSSVTNMASMFLDCESLKKIDLSHFDTSNVQDMNCMFYLCYELEEVDMRNFDMTNVPKKIVTGNVTPSTPNNCEIFGLCDKLRVLRLDNCSNDTIDKIISSYRFPTGTIDGETRKIYCKRENAAGLTAPDGWEFIYMDTLVSYDESQEKLLAPDYVVAELIDEQLIINDGFADYDADNENININ